MVAEPIRNATNPRTLVIEYTRQLVDRVVDNPERVAISEILEQVEKKFLVDQAFAMSLAIMNVREIARAAIREAVAETRGPARRVIVRDAITTPLEQVRESQQLMSALALRWGRFREWNGTVHVKLTAMTRQDLLAAAAIRRERATREMRYAIFWERLAARLPDDETTVGAAIPYEEIERAYAQAGQDAGVTTDDSGEEDTGNGETNDN
jgi:DNA-binding PucR family transcriptional regulator